MTSLTRATELRRIELLIDPRGSLWPPRYSLSHVSIDGFRHSLMIADEPRAILDALGSLPLFSSLPLFVRVVPSYARKEPDPQLPLFE